MSQFEQGTYRDQATVTDAKIEALRIGTNSFWREMSFAIRKRWNSGATFFGVESLVLWLLVAPISLNVYAQSPSTGALTGTVTDPTGAVVQHAKITLHNSGKNSTLTTLSDHDGAYRFALLPAGEYELTVEAMGFAPLVLRGVTIQITEVRSIATELALAGASEKVEVVGERPLLQTDDVAHGSVIDRATIVTLPLVNRNYTQILGLTAGTNTDVVDATLLGAGSQEIRANGARSGDNNFMLNGIDSNSYGANMTEATPNTGGGLAIPAPDTIQEFKVQTSLYDAQYGRGGGANVVVETRSGTSELHGNAYYFGRNELLDANNFFANATGIHRGEFRRNQPGGTLGGPVPSSKKQAFFFVSYQATRDVNAASLASSVRSLSLPPIPLVRTPASLGAAFGGRTGVFGGVAVAPDGSNINPVALSLLNARNPNGSFVIPSPQIASSGVNYTAVLPGRYDEDQFNTNFDVNLTKADQLSAKFFFSNSDQNLPFSGASVPGFPALRDFGNRNLAIAETHTFSPQTVNQFRAGFSRIASRDSGGGRLTAQAMGIGGIGDETSLPNILILGAFQLGNAIDDRSDTANNNFHISNTLSLSRRRHNLRFGAEIFRNQFNQTEDNTGGLMTLLSFSDFLLGLPAGPMSGGGNGTSVSNVFQVYRAATVPHMGFRSTAVQSFAVDDWKISPALTIIVGLRAEANGQPSEIHGHMGNFYPELYVPPPAGGFTNPSTSGLVLPDNYNGPAPEGYPRRNSTLLNDPVQLHLEPRLGLAWRPLSSRDIVVRGGYGVYANRNNYQGAVTLANSAPFQLAGNLIGAANAASSLQQPFPLLPPPASFPNFVGAMLPGPPYSGDRTPYAPNMNDPDFREATIQHYDLGIQYQHDNYLFTLAYAGAKGTHLVVSRSNNQPALASPTNPVNGLTTNSAANADERVPFPGIAPLVYRVESSGNSSYNSLEATIEKRLSHGLQFLAAYTLSKSIDSAGDSLGVAALGLYGATLSGEQVFNDQNNVAAQRGPSDFDRRHRFVLSYVWELPKLSNHQGLARTLTEGWAISGVATLQSGLPFSILDSAAGTLFGPPTLFTTGSVAAGETLKDAQRGGSVSSRVSQFFNTHVFVPALFIPDGGLIDGKFPVTGGGTIFGNLGRNILRGPDQRDFDIALLKRTKLADKASMVFRWEVFNVLNRPNFANPASDVSSPGTFGKISAMSVNPRIMQIGAKLEF